MIGGLLEQWRSEMALYERSGQQEWSDFLDSLAAELERYWNEVWNEALDLAQAATESGYSTDQLRRHIQQGTMPNASSGGEIRILRRHLPRKPGHGVAAVTQAAPSSRTQAACVIATRED